MPVRWRRGLRVMADRARHGLRRLTWSRRALLGSAFTIGCALGLCSLVAYAASGYGSVVVGMWLAGLGLLGVAFSMLGERLGRVAVADVVAPAVLVAAFAPLYLARAYRWPVQVGSDEVSIMTNAQRYATLDGVDLFGVSDYLGHPAALLVALGKVGGLVGGVDLLHMRLVHGALGLMTIAASYALFRQLQPRAWAMFAACVIGLSHSFLMISRMAMRENTCVLLEVVALALLVSGLRHGHRLLSFLGGVMAGAGFYVYYPARFTIVIWAVFALAVALFGRSAISPGRLRRAAVAAAMGFVLVATPILVAEHRAPPEQVALQRHALLIYPEARATQQGWVFASSEWEGIRQNVVWGLTALNNRVVDHSWIYVNPSHGFLDPLSGILLWIGVALTAAAVFRRREDPWPLLALCGFAILWLSFALLVNKAPNYTRLLAILPFVALLATTAVRFLAEMSGRLARRAGLRHAPHVVAAAAAGCLLLLTAWNLSIARDYIDIGTKHGDLIGNTGRYIESQRDDPAKTFHLATNDTEPYRYYDWGYPEIWKERLGIFTADRARVGEVISPDALARFTAPPPFAVFMRRELWNEAGPRLLERYEHARAYDVTPDASRIVVEVPAANTPGWEP